MKINVIDNAEPVLIGPEMMERGIVYKVWNGETDDLYCFIDNDSGESIICFYAYLNVISSVTYDYINAECWKLEKTDLQLTITLAPRNYSVTATIAN